MIRYIRLFAILITGVTCILMPQFIRAQTTYKLFAGKDVVVNVMGTSNLNNWKATSLVSKGQGDFQFDSQNRLRSVSMLNFSIYTKSLKSGDKTMDSRLYKALKANDFPEVTFKLNSSELQFIQKNTYKIEAKGDLCIAGVTQPVVLNVNVITGTNNTVACSGRKKNKIIRLPN